MKVKKITLENFRCYSGVNSLSLNDLTVIAGRNDVGKSTWLEALDIFFETGQEKAEKQDGTLLNGAFSESFSISVSFYPPEELVIDATALTNLKREYLLDKDGFLTVKKVYKLGKKISTYLVAYYPIHEELGDLLTLKLPQLKEKAKHLSVDEAQIQNKTKSSSWREAIRSLFVPIDLSEKELLIDEEQEEMKKTWKQIEKYIPIFGLFRVDRKNEDQDSEVQDPLKLIVKQVLTQNDIASGLDVITRKVKVAANDVAIQTIEKLKSMNPELASHLQTDFKMKSWDTVFSPVIQTDQGIPLNKRGSGVRRLVLINFFRVEAERRKNAENKTGIFYALEEPETSQHPTHQKMLVDALQNLARSGGAQIVFTTHSPQILVNINYEDIRFLNKLASGNRVVEEGDEVLLSLKNDLGVLPNIFSKVLFCVEGQNDIKFLKNINDTVPELKEIINLHSVTFFPLNGGFINQWAREHYLKDTSVCEFHLYDRGAKDVYRESSDIVKKWPDCRSEITSKFEMENYIHPGLINKEFGTDYRYDTSWDKNDLVNGILSVKPSLTEQQVKTLINSKLSKLMTKNLFKEIEAWDEVENWFKTLKSMLIRP